jgi:hypothetical protein
MAPASSIPATRVRGALKGLKKAGIIRGISVWSLSVLIEAEPGLYSFVLTHFLYASRHPLTATLNQKR